MTWFIQVARKDAEIRAKDAVIRAKEEEVCCCLFIAERKSLEEEV